MGPLDLDLLNVVGLVAVGLSAGWLGALVGIGGGVVVVPALVLLYGVEMQVAVATSLIAVAATSVAAGSTPKMSNLANTRLGVVLGGMTVAGGVVGGLVAVQASPAVLAGLFAIVAAGAAVVILLTREPAPVASATAGYKVTRLRTGSAVAVGAGGLSGLLGIGGGFVMVPTMTAVMRIPFRVAAATSNFMIGLTAVASLMVFFVRGFVHPGLAGPLVLGVMAGALGGAVHGQYVRPKGLRLVLAAALAGVAAQMMLRALGAIGG